MMVTFLVTLLLSTVVMLLVIAGMSIGVLNGRKAISGSCGGVGGRGCELCGENRGQTPVSKKKGSDPNSGGAT